MPMRAWKPFSPEEICTKCREVNNGKGRRLETGSRIQVELRLQSRGQSKPTDVDKPYVQRQALGEFELRDLLRKAQTESYQRDRLRERRGRRIGAVITIMNKLGLVISGTHDDNLYKLMREMGK